MIMVDTGFNAYARGDYDGDKAGGDDADCVPDEDDAGYLGDGRGFDSFADGLLTAHRVILHADVWLRIWWLL